VTHIFNAMRPFAAREPGLAGAALVSSDVAVQIILDGVHLADDTARLVWQTAGGRVALVSDAIAAAGAGDGNYTLAGIDFEVENGIARNAESVLAGSTVPMIEAVRNLVALGAPMAAALSAASEVPARIAGRPELGTLEPGAAADVVVLDDRFEIVRVLVGGDDAID
jgi:N-acetylglucosamine-6-phosphate deacetylase